MFEGTTVCVIFKNCDYLEFFKLTILMGDRGMVDTSSSTTSLTGLLDTSKVKFSLPATSKVKVSLTGVFSTSTVRLPGLVVPLLGLRQAIGAASCSFLWKEFSTNFHLSNMLPDFSLKKKNFAPKHPCFGKKISYRIGGNLPTSSFAKENLAVSLILLFHIFRRVVFDCLPYTCQFYVSTCFLKGWVFPKDRGPLDHHLLQPGFPKRVKNQFTVQKNSFLYCRRQKFCHVYLGHKTRINDPNTHQFQTLGREIYRWNIWRVCSYTFNFLKNLLIRFHFLRKETSIFRQVIFQNDVLTLAVVNRGLKWRFSSLYWSQTFVMISQELF